MDCGVTASGLRYNAPNVGNGLTMLRTFKTGSVPCVFFDPQYRGVLDHLDYGNEGERQIGRATMPQMSADLIVRMMAEIARVLRPSRYCFMWLDKFTVSEGLYSVEGLKRVDLIVWRKTRMGMGWRSRRVCEYVRVLQKPPCTIEGWATRDIADVWGPELGDGDHAHAKPILLQRVLIEAVTLPGEFVVDPCAGGYSVMRAAHACGRQFLGIDFEPC